MVALGCIIAFGGVLGVQPSIAAGMCRVIITGSRSQRIVQLIILHFGSSDLFYKPCPHSAAIDLIPFL